MDEQLTTNRGSKGAYLNKISFWVLLLVTALLPVFFLPVSFVSVQFGTSLLFSFGVILSALLYIISGITSGSLDLPKTSKYILGFSSIVPIVYFMAGVSNGFSRMSFFGYTFDINTVGFVLLAFVYMFLVSVLFRQRDRIFYSYFAFVVSSIIFALFFLVRYAFGADVLSFGVFTNLTTTMMGTWNNVGIFFGICAILSLLTVEMLKVSKLLKIVLSIALAISLFFLTIVNFSVIWWVLVICSAILILYSMFDVGGHAGEGVSSSLTWKKRLSKVPVYSLVVFVFSVVLVIWGSGIGGYLANKMGIASVEVRPSFSTTMEIAKNTLKTRPIFGSGPNTFVTQWLAFKPNDIVTSVFWNTDFNNGIGLIPTYAVTTGLLGVLSWLLFLGYYVYMGVKSIFLKTEDGFVKYLITSSFFTSLFLWMLTFVYVPSTVIFVLTFFFTGLFFASMYLAGVVPVETKQFNLSPRVGFASSLVMVVFFVGLVSLGYGLFKSSVSLWYFQKSSYALNVSKDSKASENYMLKAIVTVPNDIYYRSLSEIYLYKLNEVLAQDPKVVKMEELQKQFSEGLTSAITAAISARDRDSLNYLNWVSLGRVYDAVSVPQLNVEGAYDNAQLAYSEAFKRNPKNPGILMLFARMAANRNDLKQAEFYARQATLVKNNYLDAYFLLSQIEVANNNLKGAIQSVTAASVIDPTNPAIFFQLGLLKYNLQDWKGAIEALERATTMTPDYANAKFFLGLSYEAIQNHEKAIKEFEDLRVSNPESKEVEAILTNLKAGKPIFAGATETKPEKAKTLPVKES